MNGCTFALRGSSLSAASGRGMAPSKTFVSRGQAVPLRSVGGRQLGERRLPAKPMKASKEEMVKKAVGLPAPLMLGSKDEIIDDDDMDAEPQWTLKYLYDGGCTVCMSLVKMLKSRRGHEAIYFEDISSPDYSPRRNSGISYADAMDTIHVIKKDGSVVLGMEALTVLYTEVGLGWVFKLAQLPLLNKAAEIIYKLISKNRMELGAGMDAIMAVGRINMEANGTGTCEADGECRAKQEPEKPDSASDENGGEVTITGSWMDHEHVLGIYTYGAGEGLRAAPIDATTGKFLVPGRSIRLQSHDFDTLIEAIDTLIGQFSWQGAIGLGLPGLMARVDKRATADWLPDSLKANLLQEEASGGENSSDDWRRTKMEFEQVLRDACNHDVIVMGGAEANGYGEITYGAGKDMDGLVMMVTIGAGIGAALFDDRILVKNISGLLADRVVTWDDKEWANAPLPDEMDDAAKWDAWGRRVEHHILKLEAFCNPDAIIIGGSATRGEKYDKLVTRLKKVQTPLFKARLGQLAGVKGAAAGAADELVLRSDLRAMRAAIGKFWAKSPSAMKDLDIRNAYDQFDRDGDGELTASEVAEALKNIGVDMPVLEIRELVYDMDTDNTGTVTYDEFKSFWSTLVASQPVTLMHTLAEYNDILEEESTSGRLVMLEVGFTYCKPCRKFEPTYHAFAERFTDARFLRINGNENSEMVTLGRDILKVRTSPSFYLFRNKEIVYQVSGANEIKIQDAILRNLQPGEVGYIQDYVPKTEEDWKLAPPKPAHV